jgi:hypothetical protein
VRRGVQAGRLGAGQEGDVRLPQRAGVADRLELTGLGQRRPLVRRRRFGSGQDDPAVPAPARAGRTPPGYRTRPRPR